MIRVNFRFSKGVRLALGCVVLSLLAIDGWAVSAWRSEEMARQVSVQVVFKEFMTDDGFDDAHRPNGTSSSSVAELNVDGTGWTYQDKKADLEPHLVHETAYGVPIKGAPSIAYIGLGKERTFGRALLAISYLQKEGHCSFAIYSPEPDEYTDGKGTTNASHETKLTIKSVRLPDGSMAICTPKSHFTR